MTKHCAFLTMENPGDFFIYDEMTYQPLARLGWEVVSIPWNWHDQDWTLFDLVVIRSPWDYQNSPDVFLSTLEKIEASGVRLLNPVSICRWNLDKRYLRELQHRGVSIVPTLWLDRLELDDIPDYYRQLGQPSALVIKPCVGAGAQGIFVLSKDPNSDWKTPLRLYDDRPVMVQPYLASINSVGEYSLFYFGGQYSHAILKVPKAGDFRVQEEHGGVISSYAADESLCQAAQETLAAVDCELLYARVDLVILDDGSPAVIELELIEPSLYFPYDDQSPQRFAEALDRMARI
jgi:glutathione synthase/RimK-type ligase-like ATP-grasp enzyme